MNENLRPLAERLVEIVLRHASDWKQVLELPPEDQSAFLGIARLAGYEADGLVHGQLKGEYCDSDGPTGQKYVVNDIFPFKATSSRGEPNYSATRRMDGAVSFILRRRGLPRDQLVELVRSALDGSRPLTPIPLNSHEELLAQYPREDRGFGQEADPIRDESPLGTTCVGVHAYCDGFMDRHRVAARHDALSCRKCHLRVVFPSKTATYGQLRAYLVSVGAVLPE